MLRRILILFIALVLTGFGLTAAYALLNFRGPEDALNEAQEHANQGNYAAVVELLDLCERGSDMRDNPQFLDRLLRLRFDALRRLNNSYRAVQDLDRLLEGQTDQRLELDRVYYLIGIGEGERARKLGIALVKKWPHLTRGYELAGEACKSLYTETLQDISAQLRRELGHSRIEAGIDAFLEYVYRPEEDPNVPQALGNLKEIYGHEPRFVQSWPKLADRLARLRGQVQEAIGYFRTSLELAGDRRVGGWLAGSFRGVSFALQQADRDDDLIAQSVIYLTRYDHRFTVEAATAAARLFVEQGQYENAIAIAETFLPEQSLEARLEGNKLNGPSLQDLLIISSISMFRLGQQEALAEEALRIARMTEVMAAYGQQMPMLAHAMASGLAAVLDKSQKVSEEDELRLRSVFNYYRARSAPLRGEDPAALLGPLLIDILRERGASTGEMTELARDWVSARFNLMEPRLALARIQIEQNQATAAMATARQVLQLNPEDEAALRLMADAASMAYGPSNQDGKGLLLQCLQRGERLPDVPNPICTLLCGEAALEQNQPDIARACARAATDVYPWARWPRHLEARAELAAGQPQDALQVLIRAINSDPKDATALRLWFQASVRTGQPLNQFLSLMVSSGMQNNEIATALLRMAIEHNSPMATAFANAAASRKQSSGELLGLAAQALATDDQNAKAALVLDKAHSKLLEERKATPTESHTHATQAIATGAVRLLESLAKVTPDKQLMTLAKWHLRRLRPSGMTTGRALINAAEQLHEVGHAQTAYYLTQLALALGDAIEIRDGKSFYLAGSLAQKLGNAELAAAHWTAALTFEDGKVAAEPLARLEVEAGNLQRAIDATSLSDQLTDPALALLADKTGMASKLANESLRDDPTDLLSVVALALVSQVAPEAVGAELQSVEPATRRSLLELLTLLKGGMTPRPALLRAQELAGTLPDSLAVRLLLARALADNGKGAKAAEIHARCLAGGSRPMALLGEIIRCSTTDGYEVNKLVRGEFLGQVAQGLARVPATIAAFAMGELVNDALAKGKPQLATKILSDLWQRYPIISGLTVAHIEQLFELGLTHEALAVLGQLAIHGDDEQRKASRRTLFQFGLTRPDLFNEQNMTALTATAFEVLESGELIGPPLAFLFADEERLADIEKPEMRRLFQELLSRCATGEESWDTAAWILQSLHDWFHPLALLDIFDEATQAHPEFAPLWLERARLLISLRRTDEGLRDARSILALVDDPQLRLDFLGMAAENRKLTPADYDAAAKIPAELIASPRGMYVFGLLAMRQGKLEQAEQMLAHAAAQPSGFHIYARALTNLQRSKADSRARAQELFTQLAEHYPNSSWARYAGSFARQLSSN